MPAVDVSLFLITGVVVGAGCLMQAIIGFGAGLFAIPILVWLDLELPQAIAVMVTASGSQVIWGAIRYRAHIQWRPVLPVALGRAACLPLGILLLGLVAGMGQETMKQTVGAGLLLVVGLQWVARVTPRQQLHWGWGGVVAVSSGFLGGVLGMGGPPLVLWTSAHNWTANQQRASLWAIFTIGLGPTLGLFYWKFGRDILQAMLLGLTCIPFMVAGSTLGFRVGGRLASAHLRQISLVVLFLLGLASIIAPMLEGD